ncbi:MAG: hypothetical protein K2Q12_05070 [Rickettsiales bacterium]|nr:hypothetical protein [Rickettsiales bacterium]
MKPRVVDFLSDAEYKSLSSYKADTRMLLMGAGCLILMVGLMLSLMLLR